MQNNQTIHLSTDQIVSDVQQLNLKIFNEKTLATLYKQIYQNTGQFKQQILQIIKTVTSLIKTSTDLALIGPLLSSLINSSINNDKQLISLTQGINKILLANKNVNACQQFDFSNVINDIQQTNKDQIETYNNATKTLEQIKKQKKNMIRKLNEMHIQSKHNQDGQFQQVKGQ